MGFGVTAVSFPEDNHEHKIDLENVRHIFLKHQCVRDLQPTVWVVNDNGDNEAHDGYGFAYCSVTVPGKFTMASFRFGVPDLQKCTFLYELANLGKLTIINEQGNLDDGTQMWAIPPSVDREHLPTSLIEDWGEPVAVSSAEEIQLFFGQSYSEFERFRDQVIGKKQ